MYSCLIFILLTYLQTFPYSHNNLSLNNKLSPAVLHLLQRHLNYDKEIYIPGLWHLTAFVMSSHELGKNEKRKKKFSHEGG